MSDFQYKKDKNYTEIENIVLNYMNDHQVELKEMTIQKLADETFTSKTTIFRLAKKLGFTGYTDMIYHLSRDKKPSIDHEVMTHVNHISANIEKTFLQNEENLKTFTKRMQLDNGALYIIGTGYSGIIGEYFYKKTMGQGEPVYYSNGADSNALFLNNIHRISNVMCISKSGETDSVYSKAVLAKEKDVGVISFTHSEDNSLAKISDIAFTIDDNQFLDQNNINSTQFYSMLLLYLEYLIETSFSS